MLEWINSTRRIMIEPARSLYTVTLDDTVTSESYLEYQTGSMCSLVKKSEKREIQTGSVLAYQLAYHAPASWAIVGEREAWKLGW